MTLAIVPLVDIVRDVSGGNAKLPQSEFSKAGTIPVIDQGQKFIAGYTDDANYRFRSEQLPVIVFGDHTKAVKFVDFPFAMGADGVKVLKPHRRCDAKYLYHYLRQAKIPDAGYSRHFKFLKELKVPLPSLPEQRRIAAILDKAEALHAKRREAIAKLDQLLQSVFLDMFGDPVTNPKGWSTATVGDLAVFITSGSRGWAKYYAEAGAKFIRIQNLVKGELDMDDCAYVGAPDSAEARRTLVREGDVLVSITADLGRTAVVPSGLGAAHVNQHIAILRMKGINPSYVSHFLAGPGGQIQFKRLNRSAVKAGLNFDDIRSLAILVPPAEIQEGYLAIRKAIGQHRGLCEVELFKLDKIFASIQQRAFAGTP